MRCLANGATWHFRSGAAWQGLGEPHVDYTAGFSFQSVPGPKGEMRATHFQGTNIPRILVFMEWG